MINKPQLYPLGSLNLETESMRKKLYEEIDVLERDYRSFRIYFTKNKKCTCSMGNCKHFDRAVTKVLGDRSYQLCSSAVDIGVRAYYDTMKE